MRRRHIVAAIFGLLAVLFPTSPQAQTGTLAPAPYQTVLDTNGNPINGAKICTYLSGTTTPVATYTDAARAVPNGNPIVTDISGRFVAYLTQGVSYKFIYQNNDGTANTCNGSVLKTIDPVPTVPLAAGNVDITGTAGEALTAGQAVYLSDGSGGKTAGQWYKADNTNAYSSILPQIGMVPASISSSASGTIRKDGQGVGFTSLTLGTTYYVGVAGAVTSTPPTLARVVGVADSTSTMILAETDALLTRVANTVLAGPTTGAAAAPTFRALVLADLPGLLLDKSTTEQSIVSSAAVTSIYSFAVPANTLGTNKSLYLLIDGNYLNNSGGADNLWVRITFGGTTIAGAVSAGGTLAGPAANAARRPLLVQMLLNANGATNSQRVTTRASLGAASATETDWGTVSADALAMHSALTIDSTAIQTLDVSIQLGTSAATIGLKRFTVWLFLLG